MAEAEPARIPQSPRERGERATAAQRSNTNNHANGGGPLIVETVASDISDTSSRAEAHYVNTGADASVHPDLPSPTVTVPSGMSPMERQLAYLHGQVATLQASINSTSDSHFVPKQVDHDAGESVAMSEVSVAFHPPSVGGSSSSSSSARTATISPPEQPPTMELQQIMSELDLGDLSPHLLSDMKLSDILSYVRIKRIAETPQAVAPRPTPLPVVEDARASQPRPTPLPVVEDARARQADIKESISALLRGLGIALRFG